jgi:large subunit ribosomal protein L23
MALFSKKEKKENGVIKNVEKDDVVAAASKKEKKDEPATKVVAEKKTKKSLKSNAANLTKAPSRILKTPRITEKAVYMTMQHAYVFDVAQDATKRDVMTAVKALYDVTPRKVNIVNKEPRAYVARFRNRVGTLSGVKKAYVFLKKGDKIDLA